ncbi:MAG: alpha/beta hydrolase [Microcystis novacekii Mn_MB_F_20050700_S1]|uniref:Alpha/beta hydrolase n=1 Tax=Microcystis novacekii Mn_MB_F_20050700_S1D TaxID=2486266 RepID=A0A552J4B7_9CHRO|nr:MAG: alpha/beta hydrolase [Microcystis novacekii Mn_MB_F_20050700_S1]TRU90618.1 MAG: alpha/beta hydrolase [Microcystis novacekii Mn_MB_F_20050700_S1D]
MQYILSGLLGLTFLSVFLGIIYQAIGTKRDKTKHLPPGKLVEVKGRQFHLHCTGEGSITVVMDYGIGGLSLIWSLVQPEVAKFARVCSYDRAGYGWSESSQSPRTSQQMVEELSALLDEAGIEGPYILVGHSLGGLNARLFASQYPEKVVGMVLVDAVPAEVYSRLSPAWQEGMNGLRKKFTSLIWVARLGLLRLSLQLKGAAAAPDFIEKLPLEVQPKILSQFLPKTFATAIAENQLMQSSAEQVCQVELVKDLPLAVLSHGVNMFVDLSVREPEQAELIWQELQKSTANLSSDSTFEIVKSSGHNIHINQPQVVVKAIHQIVEKCRSREHKSGS